MWSGEFRDDLYYRLNVFPIEVPPLRERRGDIPSLVSHFVEKFSVKIGKTIESIPDHVQASLQSYDWPGNVRELENVIERAVILASGATLLVDESLARRPQVPAEARAPRTLDDVARQHILSVLASTEWRIEGARGAAEVLGLHPNTLRSRMKKLEIEKRIGPA